MAQERPPEHCQRPILIVDAHKMRAHNLSSRLRLNGHKTEICDSGFRALYLLESESEGQKNGEGPPYLLLTISGDLKDMPGREVLLLARNLFDKKQMPILFFTEEKPKPELAQQMKTEGANACFSAEDSFQSILDRVQELTLCRLS